MGKQAKPAKKRGYARLVHERTEDGSVFSFVDTRVGGHKTIETEDGPAVASTGVRTFASAARKSHRYSALGRAR